MNMVSTEDVNSNSKINSNLFISKYKNIEKLFSKFLSQKENENFSSFIEREYEKNNEIFLLDNDEIFQTIHSESQVEDFKFEYFFGKFINTKKAKSPNILQLNLSSKVFSMQIWNIVGGWNIIKNSHLSYKEETNFNEDDVLKDSPKLPSIFFFFSFKCFNNPFDLQNFLDSIKNLKYSFSKSFFWIVFDNSTSHLLLEEIKQHFVSSNISFNITEDNTKEYRSSFIEALNCSKSGNFNFFLLLFLF